MLRFDTVLFDLDGTILYTLPDMAGALNRALQQRGYPPHPLEAVRHFVGNGTRVLIARALPGGWDNPDYDAVLQSYNDYYARHAADETRPYPGVVSLLKALGEKGVRTAVVTNKTDYHAQPLIRHFFGEAFALVQGKGEETPAKPAPDMVYTALEKLGSRKDRALFVGDSPVDGETARNAGLPCVLVTWGYGDREGLEARSPLGMIEKPEELLSYIDD